MGQLSGLAQVLDENVTEEEKALDVLDDGLHILSNEVLDSENLNQTPLVGYEVGRWDDGRHCHHERCRQRLQMEPRLKYSDKVHVEDERLQASFTSGLVRACDERGNSHGLLIQVGQAATATDNVVGLGDDLADPWCARA